MPVYVKKEIGCVCSLLVTAREAAEQLKYGQMDLQCCLFVTCEYLELSPNQQWLYRNEYANFFLFLIYSINEVAPRCTADVVFCDADEPFGAVQLIMSSVYCYKIGLPGNNHLRT